MKDKSKQIITGLSIILVTLLIVIVILVCQFQKQTRKQLDTISELTLKCNHLSQDVNGNDKKIKEYEHDFANNYSYFLLTTYNEGDSEIKEYYFFDKDNNENMRMSVFKYNEENGYNVMKNNSEYFEEIKYKYVGFNDENYTVVLVQESGDYSKAERLEMLEDQVAYNSKENHKLVLEKY